MELVEGVTFIEHARDDAAVAFEATVASDSQAAIGLDDTVAREPVARDARLREAALRDALYQLVEGVRAIHAAGRIHRDLKPTNVLVTAAGRVVILDFGLAADVDRKRVDHTLEEGVLGTPAYMAPEQARGEPATQASDWYAVGVMLYEALTGTLPYTGRTLEVMVNKSAMDAPRP